MKIVIIILCFVFSPLAHSVELYLGQWSTHFNQEREWNETHDLIGFGHNGYTVVRFKNSYSDISYLAGKEFFSRDYKKIHYGATAGIVTGYENAHVFAITHASYGILNINLFPGFVSIGFRFKL